MMMAAMIASDGRIGRGDLHVFLSRLMRGRDDEDDHAWMMLLDEMMMRGPVDVTPRNRSTRYEDKCLKRPFSLAGTVPRAVRSVLWSQLGLVRSVSWGISPG